METAVFGPAGFLIMAGRTAHLTCEGPVEVGVIVKTGLCAGVRETVIFTEQFLGENDPLADQVLTERDPRLFLKPPADVSAVAPETGGEILKMQFFSQMAVYVAHGLFDQTRHEIVRIFACSHEFPVQADQEFGECQDQAEVIAIDAVRCAAVDPE